VTTQASAASGGMRLVIVESPAKARTIAGYLGSGYVVESSIGHIRDLPHNAAEVPTKYKGLPWARLGVDVDNAFEPIYVVPPDKRSHIAKLKRLLKDADELYLATDEDREGEAIAWHLFDELKPRIPVHRMVFHEITPAAIRAAVDTPRDIDKALVDAQETRRILDRLYGYEVSPVLWKKVMSGLSAGRVQSVATRLVVDRERDRIAFRAASYWDLQATMDAGDGAEPRQFPARLATLDGTRVASGRDFTSRGELASGRDVVHLDAERTGALAAGLRDQPFTVASAEAKPYTRRPYPPFRTTTLQQEASRKLGFGASVTMQIAQRLYENGFITYMRTDSVTLSPAAIEAARDQARELFGAEYVPDAPRAYTSKVKNAQEAHEAIRPSGESFRTPAQTGLSGDQFRLYELIWMRTVASQMRDAQGRSVSMRLQATVADSPGSADFSGSQVEMAASGRVITFHGFLKAYVESLDDPDAERDDRESRLPDLAEGDAVTVAEMAAEGHETRPPARFTEATLVRELEEREIGRPSTYASIIRTILDRGYVYKKGTALVPSWLAFSVTRLLERHFARLVDYDFTARLEDVLDEVAGGRDDRVEVLTSFWSGDQSGGGTNLKQLVGDLGDIDARQMATFPIDPPEAGIALRVGRYGPYVEDSEGSRGNVPADLPPDELTIDKARELLANPAGEERELGSDPDTGRTIVAKNGRYGPYVTEVLGEAESGAKAPKPRTGSLFRDMSLDTVSLDDALRLLSLPRVVGNDPESGEPITAQNGRYGPYLKKGTDSRSLEREDQIFGITLDEALAIYAQPKQRGRAAAAPPLKELGNDPGSGKPVLVKDGRFGPYVTDGETNATLRKGDDPQSVTIERAAELLAEKRARGPVTRKRAVKKSSAKRTPRATAAKKTTVKKAAVKKTAAKKG